MAKRHDDALLIQQGACNPIAIANTLVDAIGEARKAPDEYITRDPAVRLITHQLCHVLGIMTDAASGLPAHPDRFDWKTDYNACVELASDPVLDRIGKPRAKAA